MKDIRVNTKVIVIIITSFILVITLISYFNDKKAVTITGMPLVTIEYLDDRGMQNKKNLNICGCIWETEDGKEVIPDNARVKETVKEIKIQPKSKILFSYYFDDSSYGSLTKISIKSLLNNKTKDFDEGDSVKPTDNNTIVCSPGFTYAITLYYGENQVTYAFKCIY